MNILKSKLISLQQKITSKVWQEKSIVYYTGHTDYQWTPESLKTGIGGSESAIINLAREWVKSGYQVSVYNNCGDREGLYEGVQYFHYSRFNKYDTFDTLIIWRYPWRLYPKTKAKRIFLDLHEVLQPEQVVTEKLNKFDKIFVKSQYHRSLLPQISGDKIKIITNGFDLNYLNYNNFPKDFYKIIYASNYVRGLEKMLLYGWPIIKKEVPQAHLDIYYGWQDHDDSKKELRLWKEKMIELMNQPGVTEWGRIGVEELIKEKARSVIHYYGCTFQEIDCISVRESAAVGCVPVTTDYAALSEKDYCLKVSGNPYAKETQEKLAHTIVDLLKNHEKLKEINQKYLDIVKQENWQIISRSWFN